MRAGLGGLERADFVGFNTIPPRKDGMYSRHSVLQVDVHVRFVVSSDPAIPSLLLIPGDSQVDYSALYVIATAYAHSGLVVSKYGNDVDRPEFAFPAIVCSSFAIELFLKFFLMLKRAESPEAPRKHESGHRLGDLWRKVDPEHQRLVAGMFRNNTAVPFLNSSERRIELFVEALEHVGETPFIKWRYVFELAEDCFMSHAAINEVLDALGHAASYVMKQKAQTNRRG